MKACVVVVLLCVAALFANAEDPWEPSDVRTVGVSLAPVSTLDVHPARMAAMDLIRFYQEEISPRSISRCPFLISCSNFAVLAITDNGLVPGLVMFIDRFCYRENGAAYGLYRLARSGDVLKIDDQGFLD
jgi:putative component of membrane protein insertase Oxa1/YidC/SpoIIIJ protein YidD